MAGIYEVLKDKEKRDIYDRVLVEGLPDWRSPAFYFRRMRKIGLVEALLYIFVLITVFQYFIHKAHHWEKKFTLKESEHIKIARKSTRKKQKAAGTHLTPNTPPIHTSYTYSKLNMDEIYGLKYCLLYIHTSQNILLKSLHAQRMSFLLLNLYF